MFNCWSILHKGEIVGGGTAESLRGPQGTTTVHLCTRKVNPIPEVGVRNKGSARISMVPSNAAILLTEGENPAYVTNSGAMLKKGFSGVDEGRQPNMLGHWYDTSYWKLVRSPSTVVQRPENGQKDMASRTAETDRGGHQGPVHSRGSILPGIRVHNMGLERCWP